MSTVNIFEQAVRQQLRFDTTKGMLSVEDLWQLPLTSTTGKANLDDIARGLHHTLQDSKDISFVKPTVTDNGLQLKFDIVKYIIDTRVAERDAHVEATKRTEKKQQILALIATKENEQLAGTSLDELRAMAESL